MRELPENATTITSLAPRAALLQFARSAPPAVRALVTHLNTTNATASAGGPGSDTTATVGGQGPPTNSSSVAAALLGSSGQGPGVIVNASHIKEVGGALGVLMGWGGWSERTQGVVAQMVGALAAAAPPEGAVNVTTTDTSLVSAATQAK